MATFRAENRIFVSELLFRGFVESTVIMLVTSPDGSFKKKRTTAETLSVRRVTHPTLKGRAARRLYNEAWNQAIKIAMVDGMGVMDGNGKWHPFAKPL